MTTESEPGFYDRALRRIYWMILSLGLAGAVATMAVTSWKWGLGFLVGAVASFLNFRWLHDVVSALGPGRPRPSTKLAVLFCLRYLLLGIGGYVIVRAFGLDLTGGLFGLLVPVASVLLEILFELATWNTTSG